MSDLIESKVCTKCGCDKSLDAYKPEKRNKDKKSSACRSCINKQKKHSAAQKNYQNLPVGRANRIYHTLIKGAESRGIPFNLSKEWILEKLLNGRCEVTGIPFVLKAEEDQYTIVSKNQNRNPWSPSVDRIDSSKGYSEDNCKMVCTMYNTCKGSFSNKAVEMFCRGFLSNV